MNILLVDDNPIDLMIHEKLMQRSFENAVIKKASSGQAAIEYLENCETYPELVLLDIKMPVMNGFEFLEQIINRPYIKKLVIYMVSSSIDPQDIEMARESDVIKSFLEKPLSIDALKKINFE